MTVDSDTSRPLLDLAVQNQVQVNSTVTSPSVTIGALAGRAAATADNAGQMYYATDQISLSISTGSAWVRIGPANVGDIIFTAETVARTGYLLLNGAAWPATNGIYADLFGILGGATLPDIRGRAAVAIGTHADVSTILNSDGGAVGTRRPKHKTSKAGAVTKTGTIAVTGGPYVFDFPAGSGLQSGVTTGATSSTPGVTDTIGISDTTTFGPQTGNEPIDTPAYLVLQPQVKL